MAKKTQTTDLTKLGDFYCTVSGNGQIFIPVRMSKALGINPGDSVKFSFQKDGKVIFSRSEDASKENLGQKKKDETDSEKIQEALKK